MGKATFYVTTPIYYPSDKLHIGHALTTTMADTLARFRRMQGYDVWFLTGSDEHGQKIQRKATEAGISPAEYVEPIVTAFQKLWSALGITNDDFLRTTEKRHIQAVQSLFRKIYDKGDIYTATYEGWYCTPCETFWPNRQLVEGNCPDCGRPAELLEEESYFFRMSRYADRLLEHIEKTPGFIQPVSRRNEMISFIRGGLEDLCISRTTFSWGIPVPVDEGHVIYVWFDALTNYISALGWAEGNANFDKFWPEAVHLVGKDIVRFHAIIWPIMLMAAGIDPPKTVFGHGWLLLGGDKMSKSKGNVVDPLILIDRYGSDAIRYFLLREMPYGEDGYFSEEALIKRINTDLANDYGNLVNRTVAMVNKFNAGIIPSVASVEERDRQHQEAALALPGEVDDYLSAFRFADALASIWGFVNRTNKYIEKSEPWALARQTDNNGRLDTILYHMAESVRLATALLAPFMPGVPAKVWAQLGLTGPRELKWEELIGWGQLPSGLKVGQATPIFPRLETPEQGDEQQTPEGMADQRRPEQGQGPGELVDITTFGLLDLRVAEVVAAEKVKGTDRLLKLEVNLGDERRTVVSGLAQSYLSEELVGKKVILVANLKPAKIKGIKSEGMLLAATGSQGPVLIVPEQDTPLGAKVK